MKLHRKALAAGMLIAFAVQSVNAEIQVFLQQTSIRIPSGRAAAAAKVPAQVLQEEIKKHSGVTLPIYVGGNDKETIELRIVDGPSSESERFVLSTTSDDKAKVRIKAQTTRGLLFGVGKLLSRIYYDSPNSVWVAAAKDFDSTPVYAIRGHQLGYRHAANSWDFWTVEQFDQYIRELAFFGTNCIENIPFQDDRSSPLMKLSREEANLAMGEICAKYDLDYWGLTAAD